MALYETMSRNPCLALQSPPGPGLIVGMTNPLIYWGDGSCLTSCMARGIDNPAAPPPHPSPQYYVGFELKLSLERKGSARGIPEAARFTLFSFGVDL